ncbi:DUF421 domain-containing protein [Bacillus solitudinis]|uniref:DUF421 domain-containing protein n=1 Tax=Bacillus solitudinis TaxID=2014074 RepID=UPI000C23F354|nr:DUF421 domain-containing protein [Bacillus solitudinis]
MFDFWVGSESLPIYGFLIRAIIIYGYIFLIVKILGQRSISSVEALDFIFAVVIGDVLGEPLADGSIDLAGPFSAAALIAGLHLGLTYMALKTPRFRRVIENEPIILMKHGTILHEELKKAKITLESFLMDLRLNSTSDLREIDYAVLEMNGAISVIKKSIYEAVTPSDLKIPAMSKGYSSVLIDDGQIIDKNVKKVGTVTWLRQEIQKRGYSNPKEIFCMTIDETGDFYISPKKKNKSF